ncbi:5850_t:CDS:1 [Paraglomus occultum]|uniref:5850_t:CDS:1 n=1 Tax=Paraglomus occultum TaxID=144539 RepID=A0A9N8YZ10_9GLOM|nr:5850_t:CDS:1 [Paraglomus occultum]
MPYSAPDQNPINMLVTSERHRTRKDVRDIHSTSPLSVSPRPRRSNSETCPPKIDLKACMSVLEACEDIIRKQNGEIVKSSLKKAKSAPVTPTCPKTVHFDENDLEHIKWFFEQEKPRAVSAEVSSEEEFSSDDSETSLSEDEEELELVISLPNFPRITTMHSSKRVFLEKVYLSPDRRALMGRIHVRNLAFQKSVSVRYSFDFWQTYSEISATYSEKAPDRKNSNFDVFVFSIEFIDNSRNPIDGRTMYFAVRYNVNLTDYWDNNNGSNYQVDFKRVQREPVKSKFRKSAYRVSKSQYKTKKEAPINEEFARSPPSVVSLCYTSSNAKKKFVMNRYNINDSLSAAMTTSRPKSLQPTRCDGDAETQRPGASRQLSSYSPPTISYVNNELNKAFFPVNRIEPSVESNNQWDFGKHGKMTTSTPIAIPSKPAIGSTSYFELVERYCFFQGTRTGSYANSPPIGASS